MQIETLKSRQDFLRVGKHGQRQAVSCFVLLTTPTPEAVRGDCARVGYTISGKVGKAVERNRMRRRLKETVRAVFAQHARAENDYVFIGRRKLLDCPFGEIERDMIYALRKLSAASKTGAVSNAS